jgi:hypothetical protein
VGRGEPRLKLFERGRRGGNDRDFGQQRLVEPRLHLDLAQSQRRGVACRQQQRGDDRHSQFADHARSNPASPPRL